MYGKQRFINKRRTKKTRPAAGKKTTTITRYSNPSRKLQRFGSKWKNPLPSKAFYKFKYQDSGFSATLAIGNVYTAYNVYSGNSLFDPDATGVGVQPYAFDQLCGDDKPFGFYMVYGSKIKVYPKIISEDEQHVRGIRCVVAPIRYGSGIPTRQEFEDVCQIPGARRLAINSVDDQHGKLVSYMSTARIVGDKSLDIGHWGKEYSASPDARWYWFFQIDSLDSDLEVTVCWDVQITYYSVLARRDDVNES